MTRPTSSSPKTRSTSNNAAVIMSFAVEKESQFGIYSLSVPTRHGNAQKGGAGNVIRGGPAIDSFSTCPPSGSTCNSDHRCRNGKLGVRSRHDESNGSGPRYVRSARLPYSQSLAFIPYDDWFLGIWSRRR